MWRRTVAAGEHTFGDWKETAAPARRLVPRHIPAPSAGRSEFVETTPALGHKSGSGYEMSDTKHWFPCALCGAHLKEANHKYTGDQCVVCNYHKVGGRIEITPLTTLPAALQSVSALSNMTKLKSQMVTAVQKVDKNIKAENTQMLDVTLMIPSVVDNKTVWSPAAKDSFPANGKDQPCCCLIPREQVSPATSLWSFMLLPPMISAKQWHHGKSFRYQDGGRPASDDHGPFSHSDWLESRL